MSCCLIDRCPSVKVAVLIDFHNQGLTHGIVQLLNTKQVDADGTDGQPQSDVFRLHRRLFQEVLRLFKNIVFVIERCWDLVKS